jgi:2,3-bisphosphoglycerate-independent phosphoglycerate mutase
MLEPLVLMDGQGQPAGCIQDGDAVIFCCRRGEREIELTEAFVEREFDRFPRRKFDDLTFVILTLYHEKFVDLPVAFAPARVQNTLGETVSRAGLRQLRVAESEKFAHVTFFLNGGNHQSFAGQKDVRIPSPRGVPFDLIPELSLAQVAGEVVRGIGQRYDLIVTNFANGDVIGHTQNCQAKLRCAEFVDQQLGRVVDAALAADYTVLVTADHGNLEEMIHPDGTPHVAHTSNSVPFLLLDRATCPVQVKDGSWQMLAPRCCTPLSWRSPLGWTAPALPPITPGAGGGVSCWLSSMDGDR